MASIELLLIIALASGFLAYLLGRVNRVYGAIVTIVSSMFVFSSLAYFGFTDSLDTTVSILPYVTFQVTYLGMFFAVMITFIYAMVSFFNPMFIKDYKYPGAYSMLYILSMAGVIGVFFTDNFMVMFFFFEFIVWTSMFLIPLGHSRKAAVSYYAFSAVGSFALLFAIFMMREAAGSFGINAGLAAISGTNAIVVFILLIVSAFAKLGAFPLHTWLPIAHGNAPHPFSPVLSGALVKLGAFVAVMALIKITPNSYVIVALDLPLAQYLVAIFAGLSIVFGTLMAIRQDDAKKLLAYSSMSHGGYILLAFSLGSSIGLSGGFYHIVTHALATGAAFLAIAAVGRQTGTTKMSELGGVIQKMPVTYVVYLIAIISMAGIPPMGGFISKWLIFQAVIDKGLILLAAAVFFGSIGSFLYVFRPLAALFLGQEKPQFKGILKEAPVIMLIPMIVLSGMNLVTGIFPNIFLQFINKVIVELGMAPVVLGTYTIQGTNGILDPLQITIAFGIGVVIAFIIFILLKKSKQVGLMDTYTAGNFIYSEELMHYSVDFYAPIERLYEKHTTHVQDMYKSLENKVKEFGNVVKYFFFTNKPEITVFWILIIIGALLWGDLL
ncbi:MAG: NADH-quinone oxidoreductase subunit M [Bacilli bacterium]|nr:NADH-quinone oxidoreductase subunit M [Bacilli bacterium]